MNPQYYVRTAPHQPTPRLAFSAFSIRPAQAELFDVAHVILLAEAVDDAGVTRVAEGETPPVPSSHQALRLIRRIMQQETALPVVRRLVEALRQANTILYNEQQGARIIAGVLVKNTLYLTCVGAMGAYIIRHEKVAVLLQAERTRNAYLGQTLQLQLDYQLPTAAALFAEAQTPHAYVISDRFLLAPGDSVVFCSTELLPSIIKPALIHARRPERLAAALVNTVLHQTGITPGVIALHWHVNRVMQTAKQVALVLFIFFCVTAAMQSVIFVNQHLEQWLMLQRGNMPVRDLPPILYDTAAAPEGNSAGATPNARTSVQVNVDVNVDGLPPALNDVATSAPPAVVVPVVDGASQVAVIVPVVAADVLLHQPTPTVIQLASASLEQVPQAANEALMRANNNDVVVATEEQPQLERQVRTKLSLPTPTATTAVAADTAIIVMSVTPTLSPLALLPVAATPTNTALPTATAVPLPTPTPVIPTATPTTLYAPKVQPIDPPALPTATATVAAPLTVLPTATPTTIVTTMPTAPATTPEQFALTADPVNDSITLLAPPDQTSSSDLITFAWQGQTPLPAGQAYEVIIWQPGQTPLTDGLGIAPPRVEESLPVQLHGLHEAGIIQPGAYHWGVLRVTVNPYTRLALLSPVGAFTFDGPDQAPRCNPDRETC